MIGWFHPPAGAQIRLAPDHLVVDARADLRRQALVAI
jgi:hypothetical protein